MECTPPAVASRRLKENWPPLCHFAPALAPATSPPLAPPPPLPLASSFSSFSQRPPPLHFSSSSPNHDSFAASSTSATQQHFHQLPWEFTHFLDHAPPIHTEHFHFSPYPNHHPQQYQQQQQQIEYLPPQPPSLLPPRTLPQPFNFDFSFTLDNAPTMPSSYPGSAVANANANVIDLTLDDSPPRSVPRREHNSPYPRPHRLPQQQPPRWPPSEVIDLDAIPDDVLVRRPLPAAIPARPRPATAASDEIEVTLERPASQPLRHIPAGNFRLQPLEPFRMYPTADFERDNRPPAHADARRESMARLGLPSFDLVGIARNFMFRQDNAELVLGVLRPPSSTPGARRAQTRNVPDDEVQFIGTKQETPVPACRPGFTRSPKEDDLLVCPNCDEELSVGDHPEKKQIWMVRACGHIYCGECTLNRFKAPQQKKNKPHPPKTHRPFAECRVEGCTSTTKAPKSMVRIRF